jgi:cytochrome c-type biogenesis protein CcmH
VTLTRALQQVTRAAGARIAYALVLLAASTFLGLAHAQTLPELGFDDPELNQRYQNLLHEVRCPQCRTETIAESNAPIAADLRREIRKQMAEGASDDEIVEFLLARYGEFVLYRPRFTPKNYALWAGPFVFLALGGLVFWRVLRVRQAQPLDLDDNDDDNDNDNDEDET